MSTLDARMVALSVQLIQAGRRTLDEVPDQLKNDVKQALNAANQPPAGE
ncbi:CD1375 family protein [Paenibacillus sp. TAB 01]